MSAELLIPAMLDHATITALIGNRLALQRLPQNSAMPACVYNVISDNPDPNIDYQSGPQLTKARVQINPLALTVGSIVSIHAAIRSLLDFKHNTTYSGIKVLSSRVDFKGPYEKDDETGIWTRPVDYILQYYE